MLLSSPTQNSSGSSGKGQKWPPSSFGRTILDADHLPDPGSQFSWLSSSKQIVVGIVSQAHTSPLAYKDSPEIVAAPELRPSRAFNACALARPLQEEQQGASIPPRMSPYDGIQKVGKI